MTWWMVQVTWKSPLSGKVAWTSSPGWIVSLTTGSAAAWPFSPCVKVCGTPEAFETVSGSPALMVISSTPPKFVVVEMTIFWPVAALAEALALVLAAALALALALADVLALGGARGAGRCHQQQRPEPGRHAELPTSPLGLDHACALSYACLGRHRPPRPGCAMNAHC